LLPFGVAIAVEQDSSGVLVRWRCEERIFNKTKKNNPTQKIINCDRKREEDAFPCSSWQRVL